MGIGLTVFFEHIDNTLKTPEDVKEHLGLPFLGMVPDVGVKTANTSARPSPLILKNPQSAVAEAYRVLRTNLIFSSAETSGRALVVTSANPGEGKTTTVANLASSLALNGAKVLAVDADLRRPTMHQHFGIPKTPGLSDLIVGKCQASEAIQTTRFKGLQVLPCGYVPPNPAELLGSAAMKQVVEALRSHYDWVLIDTPPILAMADTPVLCPLVEGVILVIGAEVSGRPAIQRAVDQITSVGGKVLGVVLNKVDLERNSYYYGQYYGEYYRSYYAEGASRQPRAAAGTEPPGASPRPAFLSRPSSNVTGLTPVQAALEMPARKGLPLLSFERFAMRQAAAVTLVGLLAFSPVQLPAAPALGTVQGTVTLAGRPVTGVEVAFIDLQSGAVFRATSGKAGAFEAKVAPGQYAVATENRAGLIVSKAPAYVPVVAGRVASAQIDLLALPAAVLQDVPAPGAPARDSRPSRPPRPRPIWPHPTLRRRRRRSRRRAPCPPREPRSTSTP